MTDAARADHVTPPTSPRTSPRTSRRRGGRHQALGGDERAISNVLGAILLFGLMVVTFVTIQTQFVPVWDEQAEARHMGDVAGQLGLVKSAVDRQADNRSSVPITETIALRRDPGFRFFQGTPSAGTLSFNGGTSGGVEVNAPRLTILAADGQSVTGLAGPEDWLPIDTVDDTITDLTEVLALRMRIDLADPGAYDDGEAATLLVTDRGGAFAGRAVVTYLNIGGSERALRTQTFNAANQEVSSHLESFFHNTDLGYFYIDLLADDLLFDAVMQVAQGPLTLAITEAGLEADYVIAYREAGSGGGSTIPVGATGTTVAPYDPTPYPAGVLRLDGGTQRYVAQTYVLEHGALLLAQPDGTVMSLPPAMGFGTANTLMTFDWTLPSLAGTGQAITGSAHAAVTLDPTGGRTSLVALAPQVELVIPTAYAQQWADFLEGQLNAAGYTRAAGHFTLDVQAQEVILELRGSAPGLAADDVLFTFHQSDVEVSLRATS